MITSRMAQHDVPNLISLSIRFLRPMQLPDGLFCLERVRGGRKPRGRSLRYTAMTYLGLRKAGRHGHAHGFDIDAIRSALEATVDSPDLKPGDYGLYLWAGAGDPQRLVAIAKQAFASAGGVGAHEGQEVAWLVLGLLENDAAGDGEAGAALLREALDDLLRRCEPATGLVYHYGARHRRRRFANFATQIYSLLALSIAAENGFDDALPPARGLADRLIELQLRDGGWPWLFDVRRGTVVEPYEVYSVHQHAMAPMGLLAAAEATEELRYVDAAVRGLAWIDGRNELGIDMVDEDAGFIYRSIRRKRPFDRAALYAGTAASLALGRNPRLPGRVELNPTCRPYELGWLLEAWCGREQLAGTRSVEPVPGRT
jgi:hypothetical protein